jgi:hypothetical protein
MTLLDFREAITEASNAVGLDVFSFVPELEWGFVRIRAADATHRSTSICAALSRAGSNPAEMWEEANRIANRLIGQLENARTSLAHLLVSV